MAECTWSDWSILKKNDSDQHLKLYRQNTIQIAHSLKFDAWLKTEGWEVFGIEKYRASEGGDVQPSSLKSSSLKAGATTPANKLKNNGHT